MSRSMMMPFAGLLVLAVLLMTGTAQASEIYKSDSTNVAIDGMDPVAYFTAGRPVAGSADHTFDWKGATWRFSSADNLALFKASPGKYAPQYGGYCAWAVSKGYSAPTEPETWTIVDGKLYLNYSMGVKAKWQADQAGRIKSADGNWPDVRDKLK